MSAKDMMASGMIKAVVETLPTEYEIQNPVSQFLCDSIDKVLEDSKLVNVIKAQVVKRSNDDPNGVLQQLVTLHNDGVLIRFHNDIETFIEGLNEAEGMVKTLSDKPDDNPDTETEEIEDE